jgi:hypothetical protein
MKNSDLRALVKTERLRKERSPLSQFYLCFDSAVRLRRARLFRSKRKQRHIAGPFYGDGQLPLMFCAISGNTAGQNFTALSYEFPQPRHFFIVNGFYLFHTEAANPLARAAHSITFQFGSLLFLRTRQPKTEHPRP